MFVSTALGRQPGIKRVFRDQLVLGGPVPDTGAEKVPEENLECAVSEALRSFV